MGIVLARIDNRLLHGIVATQWAGRSGAQRIMIIDDTVANNELTKASMKLARPTGMAISIFTPISDSFTNVSGLLTSTNTVWSLYFPAYKKLKAAGTKLYAQYVPADAEISVDEFLK